MAENEDKDKKVEREEEFEIEGSEERPTSRSEAEEVAAIVKYFQLADSYYR